jgi:integrase
MRSGAIQAADRRADQGGIRQARLAHLFRDCAVTELVDFAPEEIGIAPDLLGHVDLQTTQKHYIQSVGMRAHLRVQDVIDARRRAAPSGDSAGTSRA